MSLVHKTDEQDEASPVTITEARLAMLFAASWLGLHLALDAACFVRPTRGRAREAMGRMVLVYVLCVGLDIPEGVVADALGRDRKTVAHALRVMEDMRDQGLWDRFLEWTCQTVAIGWRCRLNLATELNLFPDDRAGLSSALPDRGS